MTGYFTSFDKAKKFRFDGIL